MLTTVILSADLKLTAQLETWLRQVATGTMKTEVYSSLRAYNEMLARAAGGPVVGEASQIADESAQKRIALFIIDVDMISGPALQWIEDLQRNTREAAPMLVEGRVPKVLMMAYEGGIQRLEAFQSELVDDLILRPIDKTLMQQKTEFLIADSPRLNPSFLFRAETEQNVEVGRDVVIEEISEFAVAVRGSEPVGVGTSVALHSEIFGKKNERRVIVRAYESTRHPVRSEEYLTKFSCFGMTPSQLGNVRDFLRSNQNLARPKMPSSARGMREARAGARVAVREKMQFLRNHRIALIDMNQEVLREANSILETSFKNSVMKSFSSFARFSAEIEKLSVKEAPVPGQVDSGGVTSVAISPSGKKLSLIMRGKSLELVRFEPALKETESFLGAPAMEWIHRPEKFMQSVAKDDKEAFVEFIRCVESGSPGRVFFRIPNAGGRLIHFEGNGFLEKTGTTDGVSLVRIELNELEVEEWNRQFVYSHSGGGTVSGGKDPAAFRFDAILIDAAFLQPDPAVWYAKFTQLLRTHRVIEANEQAPPVFVMADPKSGIMPASFRIDGVVDFLHKPLDRRLMAHKFQAILPGLFPIREPEPNTWISSETTAILGQETIMEELAEYGLVIRYPEPFEKGSFLRFFTPLFGDDAWILGRGYGSEKKERNNLTTFRSQFVFFGHSDELLQKIRRWIREDYVAQKDESPR